MSDSLTWVKSTFSASGNCVEVAAGDRVMVRDTRDVNGPVLTFSAAGWRDFTGQVKAGHGA